MGLLAARISPFQPDLIWRTAARTRPEGDFHGAAYADQYECKRGQYFITEVSRQSFHRPPAPAKFLAPTI